MYVEALQSNDLIITIKRTASICRAVFLSECKGLTSSMYPALSKQLNAYSTYINIYVYIYIYIHIYIYIYI